MEPHDGDPERERWERWAPTYDRSLFQPMFFRRVHEGVLRALSPVWSERVLDVGCGTGNLTVGIARLGARGVGADAAPAMVREAGAKRSGLAATFVAAAAERLPFERDSFDAAVTAVSAHHWEDAAAGMRELGRVVRPGGRVVVADVGRLGPALDLLRRVFVADIEHHHGWAPGDLASLLYAGGFKDVRTKSQRLLGVPIVFLAASR